MATNTTTSNNIIYEDNIFPIMSDDDIQAIICVVKQKPIDALFNKLKEIEKKLSAINKMLS